MESHRGKTPDTTLLPGILLSTLALIPIPEEAEHSTRVPTGIAPPPEIHAEVAAGRTGRAPVAGRANAQGADPLPTSAGVPERTRHSPGRCVGFRRSLPATGHGQQPGGANATPHSAKVGRTHPFPPGFSRRQGIHLSLPVALAARHGRECPQVAAAPAM